LHFRNSEETIADKEHVKGAADKAKGRMKEAAGKITGDKQMQAEGKFDKAKGAAHEAAGDAKTPFGPTNGDFDRSRRGRRLAAFFLSDLRRKHAMPNDDNKPVVKEPCKDGKDGNPVQAEARSRAEPFGRKTESLPELRKVSEDLKSRITEAKRRNEMPIDSALGNPDWELGAADGRLDVPDEEDDK
jgi:uncharacterized protein YjbJ (UPF0337 family)